MAITVRSIFCRLGLTAFDANWFKFSWPKCGMDKVCFVMIDTIFWKSDESAKRQGFTLYSCNASKCGTGTFYCEDELVSVNRPLLAAATRK